MSARTVKIALGSSKAGITLRAQLGGLDGTPTGAPITTGFVALGGGNFLWTYNFDDTLSYSVKFSDQAVPGTVLATTVVLPDRTALILDRLQTASQALLPDAITHPATDNIAVVVAAGVSYQVVDNRAFELRSTRWPDLAGATLRWVARDDRGRPIVTKAPTRIDNGLGSQSIRWELVAADTTAIYQALGGQLGSHFADAVLANSDRVDLFDGTLLAQPAAAL